MTTMTIVTVAPTGAERPPVLTTREAARGRIALSAALALREGGPGTVLRQRDTAGGDPGEWTAVDAVDLPPPGVLREWSARRPAAPLFGLPTCDVGSFDARGFTHGPGVEFYSAEGAGPIPEGMLVAPEVWRATLDAALAAALAAAPGADPGEWAFAGARGAYALRVEARHPAPGLHDARAARAARLLGLGHWDAPAGALTLADVEALLRARLASVMADAGPSRALRVAEVVDALAWVGRAPTPPRCLAAVESWGAPIAPDAARAIDAEAARAASPALHK